MGGKHDAKRAADADGMAGEGGFKAEAATTTSTIRTDFDTRKKENGTVASIRVGQTLLGGGRRSKEREDLDAEGVSVSSQ